MTPANDESTVCSPHGEQQVRDHVADDSGNGDVADKRPVSWHVLGTRPQNQGQNEGPSCHPSEGQLHRGQAVQCDLDPEEVRAPGQCQDSDQ
jgi:hypothetical protein